ncbi:hypothetical protein P4U43_06520 [Arthrobacter sp. EH-1B-1]|uniref:DUF4440 domain-containing protein n=1 Tax=Arthrobacter vasquezii TaxID=2977629 RepID=A0ABT6CTS7_9MICC|nr:hypothetical protein [Arthrobacter vasquezii]MDF9277446.1 hypothetical protein [Arthrobacter vasquezii]
MRDSRAYLSAARICLALPLTLTACGPSEDRTGASPEIPTPATSNGDTGEPTPGEGSFIESTDADRTDADSTAEVTALMLHSWDTTTDRTQTAAAIRAKSLMNEDWAAQQVEPERNAAQGAWLEPAQHQAYSSPSIVPAPSDVSKDIAEDKAIRAYDVRWQWESRNGEQLTATGQRIVTIYLEKHDERWYVVGHQFQDMSQ